MMGKEENEPKGEGKGGEQGSSEGMMEERRKGRKLNMMKREERKGGPGGEAENEEVKV